MFDAAVTYVAHYAAGGGAVERAGEVVLSQLADPVPLREHLRIGLAVPWSGLYLRRGNVARWPAASAAEERFSGEGDFEACSAFEHRAYANDDTATSCRAVPVESNTKGRRDRLDPRDEVVALHADQAW